MTPELLAAPILLAFVVCLVSFTWLAGRIIAALWRKIPWLN